MKSPSNQHVESPEENMVAIEIPSHIDSLKMIINTPAVLDSPPAWFLNSKCELRKRFLNFDST